MTYKVGIKVKQVWSNKKHKLLQLRKVSAIKRNINYVNQQLRSIPSLGVILSSSVVSGWKLYYDNTTE